MKTHPARWITTGWMFLFFILPLFYVLILAFLTKGTYGGIQWAFSLRAFEKTLNIQYLEIFLRTVTMAFVTGFLCTTLGSVCAWFIVSQPVHKRFLWLGFLLAPFLINSLIRLYALQSLLNPGGPFSFLVHYSRSEALMYVGLVLIYLPFAILPLYSAFEKWDRSFFEAAQDLGANPFQNLFLIVVPTLKPALTASFLVVFIPSLGEFLVPEILGGSQKLYWGQLISEAYLKWRDWPVGSAFGIILILFVLVMSLKQRPAL